MVFNSFIHTIMYTYYALTAAGYKFKAKPLITFMQISQFVGGLVLVWDYINVPCFNADAGKVRASCTLSFKRYCHCKYGVVYIAITGGLEGGIVLRNSMGDDGEGGRAKQRVGAQRMVLIRAERPRNKSISCIDQAAQDATYNLRREPTSGLHRIYRRDFRDLGL